MHLRCFGLFSKLKICQESIEYSKQKRFNLLNHFRGSFAQICDLSILLPVQKFFNLPFRVSKRIVSEVQRNKKQLITSKKNAEGRTVKLPRTSLLKLQLTIFMSRVLSS
jgi:hypothetical protein